MLNWAEYEKEEEVGRRSTMLSLAAWAIAIGLILGAVLYAAKVHADVAGAPDGSVKLERHEAPCDDADILAHVLRMGGAHVIDQFKKATLTYGGREWRSCWVEIDGNVYSIDEEGAPLEPIPVRAFKEKAGGA